VTNSWRTTHYSMQPQPLQTFLSDREKIPTAFLRKISRDAFLSTISICRWWFCGEGTCNGSRDEAGFSSHGKQADSLVLTGQPNGFSALRSLGAQFECVAFEPRLVPAEVARDLPNDWRSRLSDLGLSDLGLSDLGLSDLRRTCQMASLRFALRNSRHARSSRTAFCPARRDLPSGCRLQTTVRHTGPSIIPRRVMRFRLAEYGGWGGDCPTLSDLRGGFAALRDKGFALRAEQSNCVLSR
jgi:hypothetical protein